MKLAVTRQNFPLLATSVVCLGLYVLGCVLYERFFSAPVFVNFFVNYTVTGIIAVGMTFVILSGGIDLSVGTLLSCSTVAIAVLIERCHLHPLVVFPVMLIVGALFGAGMGCLIHFFALPPFLVTLGGLFLCQGLALLISQESVSISHPFLRQISESALTLSFLPRAVIKYHVFIFLAVLAIGIYVSLYTRFGRYIYAIGGNEQSSLLMGLPVGRTKIGVYALSSFCVVLAAVASSINKLSGYAHDGDGMELDAIATVVIGGTLLTGGVGQVAGTLLGILIFAIIESGIQFQGDLNSSWTKIAIGMLLFSFILMQTLIQRKGARLCK